MKDKILKIVSEFIKFKSIDDEEHRPELFKIISWTENRLKKLSNVYIKKLMVNGKPALVITFKPNYKQPKLFINGHLDVVPAEDNEFKTRQVGNKLFGRGVQDMKGACAVMIALVEFFSRQKNKPDVGFMFVTDEEWYGDQSKYMQKIGYKPQLMITLEPTDLDLVIETKGMIWLRGTITGKAAHGSRPWLGKSALELFQTDLKKFYSICPPLKKEHWQTTYSIGTVQCGDSFNTIPSQLSFTMDIRYVAKDNPQMIIKKLKKCFFNTIWEIVRLDPPHTKAKDQHLIKQLYQEVKKVESRAKYTKATFCTDARFFAIKGISSAVLGVCGGNMHSQGEWVDIKSLDKLFLIMKNFCNKL
ncbi:MAG TPA: hypothetical protein DEB09_01000 [Candidatus Magasanikbacteria bacterium]|nr:hypothetical protein [Candidatus Magasanikbacteria bacterium]